MNEIQFTIPEILSLMGLTHCVYVIVHMGFRKSGFSQTILPVLYFAMLAGAFFFDAAQSRLSGSAEYYPYWQWFFWFIGPLLSVLLVTQISDLKNIPSLKDYWVLLLLPFSFLLSFAAVNTTHNCTSLALCEPFMDLLNVTGLMAGTISLLLVISKQNLLKKIKTQKFGRERYWLILSLVALNALFLGVMFMQLNGQISAEQTGIIKTILGIGFVYLVSTSFFRIFPKPVAAKITKETIAQDILSDEELKIARKIQSLLDREKIYQEPAYSRTDLAQECGASESVISRIINVHFQKSFPQLMNEYRIEDAKRLLLETNASVKVISGEVGFNSLPSFNRAFKETTDMSPTEYKNTAQKA